MKMKVLPTFLAGVLVASIAPSASAILIINPTVTPIIHEGTDPSQPSVADIQELTGVECELIMAYKMNFDGLEEEGPYEGSYATGFFLDDEDAQDADGFSLTWTGPDTISNPQFLLVKDGNHDPWWYLFDITGWDGKEEIQGLNFWSSPDEGAISNVALYSCTTSSVSDGGVTLLLLGVALGLIDRARRIGR